MEIFIDFEFLEGNVPLKIMGVNIPKWLIKPNNTIQPISIGMVSSDNKEYYAISKDFNLKEAWNRWQHGFKINAEPNEEVPCKVYWIRENVLKPIWRECFLKSEQEWYAYAKDGSYETFVEKLNNGVFDNLFTFKSFKHFIKKYGKSNEQIAKEIKEFVGSNETVVNWNEVCKQSPVEFYAYFADYDWVVFCQLFGTMNELPTGFPKYCIDLKQILDEKVTLLKSKFVYIDIEPRFTFSHNFEEVGHSSQFKEKTIDFSKYTLEYKLSFLKKYHSAYPQQTNNHNALSDARFNLELYKFLKSL